MSLELTKQQRWTSETAMNPSATMYDEEMDVVVEIINLMVEKFFHAENVKFLLSGQKEYKNSSNILLCTISDSEKVKNKDFLSFAENFVTESVAKIVNDDYDNVTPTGIHSSLQHKTLVLNCEYGRFLCSCYADFPKDAHLQSTLLLLSVAKIIANLCRNDKVLQDSWKNLTQLYGNLPIQGYADMIDSLFEKCELQSLKRWKEWASKEEIPLFFE